MRLNEEVEYLSIYFVMGESPQGWTRNAIKDPPSGGWSNAFVIREEGFLPKIFVAYTLQSWPVPKECYELERTREPVKELDKAWMLDCLVRNEESRRDLGVEMDRIAAGKIIEAMGFEEVPVQFLPEDVKPTAKERKAREKVSKPNTRAGLTTVAQIAEELKIIPRIARGYLRALKIEKPEHGWAGNQAWADSIREALKAEMGKVKPERVKPAPKAKPETKVKPKAKKVTPKPAKKAPARAPKAKAGKKKAPAKKPVAKKSLKKKGKTR